MIDLGFDINVSDGHNTALAAAGYWGTPNVVQLLSSSGASRAAIDDYENQTPFERCLEGSIYMNPARSDHVSCIRAFFEAGEPVPAKAAGNDTLKAFLRSMGAD